MVMRNVKYVWYTPTRQNKIQMFSSNLIALTLAIPIEFCSNRFHSIHKLSVTLRASVVVRRIVQTNLITNIFQLTSSINTQTECLNRFFSGLILLLARAYLASAHQRDRQGAGEGRFRALRHAFADEYTVSVSNLRHFFPSLLSVMTRSCWGLNMGYEKSR